MKRVSIKDIARRASVSHSTVSRALRGSPLISADTIRTIREIADELGYRPSAVARSLVTSRTGTIGLVVTSLSDPFAAEVAGGVEAAALEAGYAVILATSYIDPELEMKVVRALDERRVDGIIVTASRAGAAYFESASQTQTPLVLVNNQHPHGFDHAIGIDNCSSMRKAAEHLLALGHRDIAYIGDRLGRQSDAERLDAYTSALKSAGLPVRPEYAVEGDGKSEEGCRAMEELLSLERLPTAVLCYNDLTAIGAIQAVRARGLRVPQDISIAGFDDIPFAAWCDPPLTTVRQPMRDMGRMAMERLVQLLEGMETGATTNIEGELIVRASTAPPRA